MTTMRGGISGNESCLGIICFNYVTYKEDGDLVFILNYLIASASMMNY